MNNKGITLVTIVVMIIIIIIIATVSILAGNKLIVNTSELASDQMIETVREAVQRREAEMRMQGSITPLGDTYIGQLSPVLSNGEIEATGWYLLNPEQLSELGVKNSKISYLVNYQRGLVISMDNNNFVEEYLYYYLIAKAKKLRGQGDINDYYGVPLSNPTATDNGESYIDKSTAGTTEMYGKGWYKVTRATILDKIMDDFPAEVDLMKFFKNEYNLSTEEDGYLVNYEDDKIVKKTPRIVKN